MILKLLKHTLGLLVASTLIYVSSASAIPSSHCHCHDPKSSPRQKAECPFGQLRAISHSISTVAAISIEAVVVEYIETQSAQTQEFAAATPPIDFDSRAPPALHI